jgi:hypothetical protein
MTMLKALATFTAEDADGELVTFVKDRDRVRAGHEPPGTRHLFEAIRSGPGSRSRSEVRTFTVDGQLIDDPRYTQAS